MFTVVLESKSTRPDVTPEWLAKVAAALTTQLQRDFCPDYGLAAWSCTSDASKPGWRVVLWNTADEANVAGYHFVGPDGRPVGKVFTDGASLDQLSVTLSHEVLELVGDEDADRFRLAIDGVAYAEEACDAVEDVTYEIDGVTVSDFVLPAWYDPSAPGPWDHLGVLKSPLSKTPGGYTIELKGGQVDTNPPEAKARKSHPASRTSRRLARGASS